MTYRFTDPDGNTFEVDACMNDDGSPVVVIDCITARIPVDRVEELVAGIRDTARQAAGRPHIEITVNAEPTAVQQAIGRATAAASLVRRLS
ncbi:hypothetical protein [Streptomyces sp. NRRL B-24720]|uniref:hypothetical protein n=1 Tax=Streptomyces sp. NRRL B-24720 TaxID=1476876 RepID=UPI0004C62C56|nr:hypothetical protein [Streptomyces sp. NRRL B-24720]